ncbi:ABC transporter ATP-binding protein [Marinisporobacter balticus]|uniref:Putative ABC transport system ATP-binding protein n=1 Tax=Marinisporobacter balticus TaxID=2018667 RepID=A0A4R2KWN9_9FIRM|nr:ABC transporter ATP-binding protein [Marinisporobacter balticus]TCO77442.1 putative ABC transport system ATP-binding protein [Marinisporobacter balticus]
MDQENIIYMKDVVKSYKMGNNELVVLKEVSLQVKRGEFVAVLGPSGSGKSTLMNIIGCIDVVNSGEYRLSGQNIDAKSEDELSAIRNREIGFVFQKFNLLPKYTAIHNVQMPLLLRGLDRKTAYEKAKYVLEKVGLGDRIDHKPLELSGGQQQRVSIARALVGDPNILLADEPTGALDSQTGKEIMDMFLQLNQQGNTIVIITHDEEIAQKAKRIIHVKDGNIYQ